MSSFNSLGETSSILDEDKFVIQQGESDYTQTRETVYAGVANSRWLTNVTYVAGSQVVASNGKAYYALISSTGQDPVTDSGANWRFVERDPQVVNFFKTNQNWNIKGVESNDLPSSSSTVYADGEEIAAGIVAYGEVTITYTSGIVSGAGSYYREYEGIDLTSGFYGVKLADDTISQTGVTISLEGGNTRVTVNLAEAGDHKFVGLSERAGIWPDISNGSSGEDLINTIYPVGHILLSMNSLNPIYYLGVGTWEAVAEGRFLVGVGTGVDENTVSKSFTSGENSGEYEHTQTLDELVNHRHSIVMGVDDTPSARVADGANASSYTAYTDYEGGGEAMNITNPSFGVYMWQRTA